MRHRRRRSRRLRRGCRARHRRRRSRRLRRGCRARHRRRRSRRRRRLRWGCRARRGLGGSRPSRSLSLNRIMCARCQRRPGRGIGVSRRGRWSIIRGSSCRTLPASCGLTRPSPSSTTAGSRISEQCISWIWIGRRCGSPIRRALALLGAPMTDGQPAQRRVRGRVLRRDHEQRGSTRTARDAAPTRRQGSWPRKAT
jgi:hypothetical protein